MLLRERRSKFACAFAEDEEVGKRITAETVRAMKASATLARCEQARHCRHLGLRIDSNTSHDVVCRRTNLHRLDSNVEVRKLFELVIHTRQLFLDVLRSMCNFFFDPGDIEKDPTVRTAAALLNLPHDTARNTVPSQQLR